MTYDEFRSLKVGDEIGVYIRPADSWFVGRVVGVTNGNLFHTVSVDFDNMSSIIHMRKGQVLDSLRRVTSSTVVHVETVPLPCAKHEIPASVLAAAVDRGERAVRRQLVSWPFGQVLKSRERTDTTGHHIEWYFEKSSPDRLF
jgi:hypothetical protein